MLTIAIKAAIAAGEEILKIYNNPDADFNIERKADNSPLTIADRRSNECIMAYLKETPYPVLSEEGRQIDYEERRTWKTLWIVDPLDQITLPGPVQRSDVYLARPGDPLNQRTLLHRPDDNQLARFRQRSHNLRTTARDRFDICGEKLGAALDDFGFGRIMENRGRYPGSGERKGVSSFRGPFSHRNTGGQGRRQQQTNDE